MKPLLVHIHMYYPQFWPELRDIVVRLKNQGIPFRMVISIVEPHPNIEAEVLRLFPEAEVRLEPNLGYDIAPFMNLLQSVDLEDFSYVIKLHTKRNVELDMVRLCKASLFNMRGSRWREALLAFSRPGNIERCLQEFEENSHYGMAAHHLVICPKVTPRDKLQYLTWMKAVELLKKLGLPEPPNHNFVMGSMFMCRAALLRPLQKLGLNSTDFPPPDPEHQEETLAHVLERGLGAVITSQGYEIRDCFTSRKEYVKDWFLLIMQIIGHFLFSCKVTRKGKLLLKVCKIPVCYMKVSK